MTTKTKTIGVPTAARYYSMSAVGGDGLYEFYAGNRRVKWNNYTLDIFDRQSRTSGSGGPAWYPELVTPVWPSNQLLLAQNKLISKVRGHQFNLGVAAAEGAITVKMITSNLSSMGLAALDLKHGRVTDAFRRLGSQFDANAVLLRTTRSRSRLRPPQLTTKDVASRWLEARYGWEPLISDCYESAKAFHVLTAAPRKELIKVLKHYHQDNVNLSASPTGYTAYGQWSSKVYYYYELTESISASRSLGLTDPSTVAWELMPYSFVIDWFIPIGTYLENLNAIPSLTGRSMSTTVRRFSGGDIIPKPGSPGYKGAKVTQEVVHLERVVNTGKIQAAKPEFKTLPEAMSSAHIFNAIALARQRFK